MKIGIDARMYSSSFTGIGRYVFELTRNLFAIDQKNEYVLFFNSPEFNKFNPPSERITKRLVEARHYSWDEQTKFLKILNQENLDLMHFTHFNAPIFYKKPCVVTIHDLTLSFFPGKKVKGLINKIGYQLVISSVTKKAKKIITVSNNTKNDLMKILKAPEDKIKVIYEAAGEEFKKINDEQKLTAVKNKFGLDKPFILYAGVFRNHKNVTGLIRAFNLILKEKKWDGNLVITGREDPFYPEVKSLPKKLGIEKNVKYPGLVTEEELICLYNLAKVFVFPSFYEGFGLPPLEAFACGTPVVASNSSSIPEICGEAALFFDPKNIPEMAEKIWEVLADEKLRNNLIRKGNDRIKDFSWKKMAEETRRTYEQAHMRHATYPSLRYGGQACERRMRAVKFVPAPPCPQSIPLPNDQSRAE